MIRGALRRWNSRLISPPLPRLIFRAFTSGTARDNEQPQPLEFPEHNNYEVQTELRLGPRRQLEAAGIGLYSLETKPLKVLNAARGKTALSLYIARRHVVHAWHSRYLEIGGHAYAWFFAKKYLEKHPDPLWWKPFSVDADMKSIVRTKTKYRLKAAFLEALRRRGYDRTGRRVQREGQTVVDAGNAGSRPEIACLYGTVDIRTNNSQKTMNTSWPDLLSWMESAVEALETELGQTESGQPVKRQKVKPFVRRNSFTKKGS